MSHEYYQCCYTNAELNVGGVVSSGWQAVAMTPGLPSTVMNTCTSLQNVNSSIQGAMTDEMGQVLDLLEICGDSNYVYTLRSKYGLIDRLGRPNMFSHALVFDWDASGALKDPNVFLSLDASNYKDNLQDAEALKSPLARLEPLDIDTALATLGMSQEAYLALIRCVYVKMTERGMTQPLHVAYDGKIERLRATLYCIYYGLPYFLRKRLSVASGPSNGAANKTLVFSINARKKQLWVDPQTGENNVLNPRIERKISRYGFADYAIAHLDTVDEEAYFEELECTAEELGDPTASDLLVLKIAHTLAVDSDITGLSNDALDGRISDALRSRPLGCDRMDGYIATLLNEVIEREMVLTDESEADLSAKVAKTQLEELRTADENYAIYRFSALPIDDAARRLANLDAGTLNRYANRLRMTPRGVAILDSYYANVILAQPSFGWNSLNNVLDSVGAQDLSMYPLTSSRLTECANALYGEGLQNPADIVSCYESYIAFMSRMYPEEYIEKCRSAAKQAYWNTVSYADFDFDAKEIYHVMKDGSDRSKTSCRLAAMGHDELWGIGGVDGLSEVEAFEAVFEFFQEDYPEGFANDEERADATDALCNYVLQGYEGFDQQFSRWLHIAATAPTRDVLEAVICTREALRAEDFEGVIRGFTDLSRLAGGALLERVRQVNKAVAALVCEHCVGMEQAAGLDYMAPLDLWLVVGGGLYPNVFRVFDDYDAAVLHVDDYEALLNASRRFGQPPYADMAAEYARSGKEGRVVAAWIKASRKRKNTGRGGIGGLFGRGGDDRRDDRRDAPSFAQPQQPSGGFGMQEPAQTRKKGFFGFGRGGR